MIKRICLFVIIPLIVSCSNKENNNSREKATIVIIDGQEQSVEKCDTCPSPFKTDSSYIKNKMIEKDVGPILKKK